MTNYKYSPFIVGIGGTTNPGSQTEQALAIALEAAQRHGALTKLFGCSSLEPLPHYMTPQSKISEGGKELVESVRKADGIILASPGYHGSISGLVKNAIDYFEEMSKDERVYLDGLPVGLIVTAYGWQATGNTLTALRSIVHALRGWPTPLGVALNVSGRLFDAGKCQDLGTSNQLEVLAKQVTDFARRTHEAIPRKKVELQEEAL